jgi:hypothetical protein
MIVARVVFVCLGLLLSGCATTPEAGPVPDAGAADAGLDYAMSIEDFRLLHIHEVDR